MLKDRRLKIEVLINSPGPHDQVRVRQPFLALQKIGVDCRLHERPFRFNSCIRPHSLVFFGKGHYHQAGKCRSNTFSGCEERGCLLLTEWDDHPNLFPKKIQKQLRSCEMAPLVACHAIHSSSAALATTLKFWNPLVICLENSVEEIPALQLQKHMSERLKYLLETKTD